MEGLVIGVTHNWNFFWEEDPSENVKKSAVINSCREIMKGFDLFTQIIRIKMRKEEENDESNNQTGGVPFFKNDQPDDVKEEPMEIKEETIDEFSDLKQEEPIADIFCPSTGNSRPTNVLIRTSIAKKTRDSGHSKVPTILKVVS
ncbi:hypothetical protein PMAYCL1PPCAC_01152, partial [Pristionchus mayeri]